MSSPGAELIGQLTALQGMLEGQVQAPLNILSSQQAPGEVQMARSGVDSVLGNVPLPPDHPKYQEIAGALMELAGQIDALPGAYQQFVEAVAQAEAALGAALGSIDNVVGWAQGG